MSSNKHARVVTSSALFDHHPVAFAASQPTPKAAAIGASFQSPTIEAVESVFQFPNVITVSSAAAPLYVP